MIDLRSDTITRPTPAMLQAMQQATLGDDARDGDETVRRLEAEAAARTGKDAAMLVASGTMANLVVLLAHAARGGELLCEGRCHTLRSELGGVSLLAGLFPRGLPGIDGAVDLDALRDNIRPRLTNNKLGTALVWMETSHGEAGGAVLPLEHMSTVKAIANENGVPVHVDGARLFNAAAALHVTAAEIARHTDSVSFCLSKGLCAPIGSLLCGSRDFIERARGFRRMVGGNLRQAGIIAAAGLHALEHLTGRLVEDHLRARSLAEGLHAVDPSIVDPGRVQTNIVRVSILNSRRSAERWVSDLAQWGVRVNSCSRFELRFVTHRHVEDADVGRVVGVFDGLWKQAAA
jgi:threonine aldolase